MNILLKFLKWQFVPHGIVVVEESGRISWLEAFSRMFSGLVMRDPKGPTTQQQLNVMRVFKRPLKRYRCRICGVHFWGWKKRDVCFKWECIKRGTN
jgi:hypothetical protein